MIDDKTPNFAWPLPHPSNDPELQDVPRLRVALLAIDAAFGDLAGDIRDEVSTAISALVGAAPAALDTIAELAAAFGQSDTQIQSIITLLGQKASNSSVTTLSEAVNALIAADRVRLDALESTVAAIDTPEMMVAKIISYSGAR